MINYKDYNDYELVCLAQELNEDAIDIIYKKYKPIIYKKALKYNKILKEKGLELNDIIQECYLILDYAIKNFNQDKDNIFYTYLNTCLDRNLINQYRKSINNKNKILNEAIPLDNTDDEENALMSIIEDKNNNPDIELINNEEYTELYKKILDKLTSLEECVFILKIQNFDYKEIASILDKDTKSIDNTIQRIKSKIKSIIYE